MAHSIGKGVCDACGKIRNDIFVYDEEEGLGFCFFCRKKAERERKQERYSWEHDFRRGVLSQGKVIRNPRRNPRLGAGDEILIRGRRWFQKSYGNTYFTATIYINNKLVANLPEQYGYGEYYMQAAGEWLKRNGYTAQREYPTGGLEPLWHYCRDNGITLYYDAVDVKREKDL